MENKQTAVEWLEQKVFEEFKVPISYQVFEKAKQMEKEHTMMAYNDGRINQGLKQSKSSEQYYKETYGKAQ
jgi:hypothetical protein